MKSLCIALTLVFSVCTSLTEAASCTLRERYQLGCKAYEAQDWNEAMKHYNLVCTLHPDSSFAHEALFHYGVSSYNVKDFDLANECFNEYLRCQSNPRYFQEAIEYKFCIAEQFRGGAKRHMFGYKGLPKWASGHESAIEIYDEVIAALPSHELAAKAHYSKGCLFWSMKEYKESIDAYQAVIRRFPKSELAPECYSLINKVYYEQSKREFQNSDLLTLAQLNQRRFSEAFPKEERLSEGEADVLSIKEIYARGLFETGKFYERLTKPAASVMYYQKAINDFPDTVYAQICRNRLSKLCPSALECEVTTTDDEIFDVEGELPTFSQL